MFDAIDEQSDHNEEMLKDKFKKHNVTAPLYKAIFSYFKKLPGVAGNEEKMVLFGQFRQALTHNASDENANAYYDLDKWIESKIESISFADKLRSTA